MRKTISRAGRTVLGVFVSGALLAALARNLNAENAWQTLSGMSWSWLAVSFGVSFAVLSARSWRFETLTVRARFAAVTSAIAITNLLVRTMPFRLGELGLPYVLSRREGECPGQTMVSLLLVRLADLFCLLLSVVAAGTFYMGTGTEPADAGRLWAVIALLMLVVAALLATVSLWLGWIVLHASRLVNATRLSRLVSIAVALSKVRAASQRIAALSRRQILTVAGSTIVIAALQYGLFWSLLRACGVRVDATQLIVGASLAQIAGSLPLPTVGSFGVHEAGWAAGFVWVGLPVADAALTGIATQLTTLAFAAVFAVCAVLLQRTRSFGGTIGALGGSHEAQR